MKKMNLIKRASAFMLSLTVAGAMLPATGAMAETSAPAGKAWETMAEVDMDGFTVTKCDDYINGSGAMWGFAAEKTVGDATYTLETEGADPSWLVGRWSAFLDMQGENKEAMNNNVPSIIKNGRLFRLNRHYSHAEDWSSFGTPTSNSKIKLNVLNQNDFSIGDRIRVTAWVYVDDLCAGYPGNGSVPVTEGVDQNQDVNIRMWLTGNEMYSGTMPPSTWTPITLEYTVNETNASVTQIKMDNLNQSGSYPLNMYLAGVKTERLVDATVGENISQIDMNGFTVKCDNYNASGAIWGLTGTKTVGDTTYTLKTDGGMDPWIIGRWSMFLDMQSENKDAMKINAPSIIKNNRLFRLNRQHTWAEDWSISGTPSSKSGIYINALQPGDVNIGDRIKVTAWVYVDQLCAGYPGNGNSPVTDGVDQNQDVNVRMWLMNPWVSNDNPGCNSSEPGNAEEAYVGTMPVSTWTPISFEYTVNDTNASLYNVKIDNYTQSGSYPLNMYLAGVQVDNITNEGTYSISGDTASGTITVRSIAPAEGSIVIAAAYQGNTFLGCDIQDCTSDTASFSISGAANADSVRAFIWDKTTLAPYISAITLQSAE